MSPVSAEQILLQQLINTSDFHFELLLTQLILIIYFLNRMYECLPLRHFD